jgi:tetratricopeptide (TPR) repeat protein
MNILQKLFGKKADAQKQAITKSQPPANPANDANPIKVFDKYGRELFITREEWRTNVLPGAIQAKWNDADQLYSLILGALNDGFDADILKVAEHLYRIDPIPLRAACIYGIVLMKNKRLDDAEQVMLSYIEKFGEEGVILTNLAKVHADRNDMQKAEDMLWHALEVDPNQDNGLGWFEAIHRERSGPNGSLEALRRIAALPGSWRAQIWLARAELVEGDLETALVYYQQSLSRLSGIAPGDVLMQISGDLGNQGHLEEILQIVEPRFVVEAHGLEVANNLIKAHLDLGNVESARRILDQLYALNRPDWNPTLSYWDTEIAKACLETSGAKSDAPLEVTLLQVDGPVWLKPSSPAATLFAQNLQEGPVICFLGSSAEKAMDSESIQHQLSDAPGRVNRALPLFLAEQLQFCGRARAKTLVPWVTAKTGGFVLSGVAWSDSDAAAYAQRGEDKSDYIVITHLKALQEPWSVELRIVRVTDGVCLGELATSFNSTHPSDEIRELGQRMLELLSVHAIVSLQPSAPLYQLPQGEYFPDYLVRLEQLLAARCAAMQDRYKESLSGEREIIQGNLRLCLAYPQNVVTRLILAQSLLAIKEIRPAVIEEFAEKVALLQKENPLPQTAQPVVEGIFAEICSKK